MSLGTLKASVPIWILFLAGFLPSRFAQASTALSCQINLDTQFTPEVLINPQALLRMAKERIHNLMGTARDVPERSDEIFDMAENLALTVADRLSDEGLGNELLRTVEFEQQNAFSYRPPTGAMSLASAVVSAKPEISFDLHGKAKKILEEFEISQPRAFRLYNEWISFLTEHGYPESLDKPEYARFRDHSMTMDSRLRSVRLSDRDRLIYLHRGHVVYVVGVIKNHEYETELPKIQSRVRALGF
jgi:hypothetical protein